MSWLSRALCGVLLALASSAYGAEATPPALPPAEQGTPEEAALSVWNREIAVLRSMRGGATPATRAWRASRRIRSLPDETLRRGVTVSTVVTEGRQALLVDIGDEVVFGILEGDLDPESGETLAEVGERVQQRLLEAIEAHFEQSSVARLLQGAGWSLAASIFYGGLIWVLFRGRRLAVTRLVRVSQVSLERASRAGLDVRRIVFGVIRALVNTVAWTVAAAAAYLWLTLVLFQFPYTQPWGAALGGWLLGLVMLLVDAAVSAVPGLVIIALIFALAHWLTRLLAQLFAGVASGRIRLRWLRAETAEATRRITSLVIWMFALAFAYPYLPGAGSVAFQGISVLLGVMISLGSASLVNHAMSGLVVVYSRAFSPGDFVRLGDREGHVLELGVLSTKLATPGGELTIPHGVTVSSATTNYTRAAQAGGSLVSTTVTIGYDAPWRQVHALLLDAAAHTPGLRSTPEPHVLQRALADFYVAYQLVAYAERPERTPDVLSELHQQIQDRFNAHGVQIMSPHFMHQPAQPVVVPQARWFAPPARETPSS